MAEVDWGHLSMIMIISLNLSLSFNSLAIFTYNLEIGNV